MEVLEYAEITPEAMGSAGYKQMCRVADLPRIPSGYGLLHCIDDAGRHWTKVTDDIEFHHVLVAQLKSGNGRLMPPRQGAGNLSTLPAVVTEKYKRTRPGWPDEWMSR